ncbi:reversion-inducing cysteine-rich protein with Kazal motifs [Lutzomyia longipalpis]|uniref:reversion-inducing cysteine-rich protein with Kazal motifs n=1 Tax=Lutzomyia longipalpis TaxID=7200 RepID=UPI0024841EA3|nr:reversion-inducing cysteine-rich protein with Kazal motifs [Lutzomyia longipalpis]
MLGDKIIVILGIISGIAASSSSNETHSCCTEVYGSCRTSCENLSLVHLAVDVKDSRLSDVRRFCSQSLTDFWMCMNTTLQAVARGSEWPGRPCCALGLSERCQIACATASSVEELLPGCRQSDEQSLFTCLDRQESGDACCLQSRTAECMQACRDIFRTRFTPTKEQRHRVVKMCEAGDHRVLQCLRNLIDYTPTSNLKTYMPCCELTKNSKCKASCQNALTVSETTQETIDALEIGGCGPPLPFDPLWQCFLSSGRQGAPASATNEISRINQIGMDSAKLHCCQKAIAPKCRRLCQLTFSSDWSVTRDDFERDCLSQINELQLRQCLDDVDEPCELGCDALSFCSNFNGRPTELFRSCTARADLAAHSDVSLWQEKGFIPLPGFNLPIRNVSRCSPEAWHAVACTLQIKPCTTTTHGNQICKEDCYELLTQCMDWTKLQSSSHSAGSLCSKLSPNDITTPCISLKPFLEPSDFPYRDAHQVSTPCRGNPCNSSQVCLVDKTVNKGFSCVTGCALGEASNYLVPSNTYVRIPVSSTQKGCLKICYCGTQGRIENCQPLPCVTYDSCNLAGRQIEHASWFYVECNICSCFAGEITCTKKQCRIPGISDGSYTSLPCNCPPHFVPVCGRNGKTYPSACVAKCAGLQDADIEYGACSGRIFCNATSCPIGSVCIEEHQVCLSTMHKPCPMFTCENITNPCQRGHPVCDKTGRTHQSLCNLIEAGAELAYRDACLENCRDSSFGPVCGINGQNYQSECEAWNDYSLVDYYGSCREIGLLSSTLGPRCSSVKCSPLPSDHCQPIVPPGACCPVCSGSLRIVYSRKQIDRALYALKGHNTHFLTLRSILQSLQRLIRVSQCRLSGFLTVETDLFVTVQHVARKPTQVQIEACHREAEKITTLIAAQSHRVTSDLGLSALTVANMAQPDSSGSSFSGSARSNGILLKLTAFLVISRYSL